MQPGAYLRLESDEVLPDSALVTVNGNLRLEANGGTETLAGLTGNGSVWRPPVPPYLQFGGWARATPPPSSPARWVRRAKQQPVPHQDRRGHPHSQRCQPDTGATVVTNGVLQVGNGANLGTINTTSGIAIGTGATLRWFHSDGSLSTTNRYSGAGTLHFLGTNGPGALAQWATC